MKVKKFVNNEWVLVDPSKLVAGELVMIKEKTYMVQAPLYYEDGKAKLPAEIYEPSITLMLGNDGNEHICMAMDYCSSSAHEFEDGTMTISDTDSGESFIFSPILPPEELEAFCKENIDKYIEHFKQNEAALEKGPVAMKKFWTDDIA